ncbi:conserved hypothetical protein, partial [Trichinella spiralis]|uniref:hypothetical protein n=1 Tax=Trichinella spiralis TaxID=6334 RepID=UPI0001EFE115
SLTLSQTFSEFGQLTTNLSGFFPYATVFPFQFLNSAVTGFEKGASICSASFSASLFRRRRSDYRSVPSSVDDWENGFAPVTGSYDVGDFLSTDYDLHMIKLSAGITSLLTVVQPSRLSSVASIPEDFHILLIYCFVIHA